LATQVAPEPFKVAVATSAKAMPSRRTEPHARQDSIGGSAIGNSIPYSWQRATPRPQSKVLRPACVERGGEGAAPTRRLDLADRSRDRNLSNRLRHPGGGFRLAAPPSRGG
jgi:hypothetical protein